jgi:ABC-type branched-subunit amino acid transport system ATPase component
MNNLIRTVLIGPTGAGKSQFCNFIHKDLTNSSKNEILIK